MPAIGGRSEKTCEVFNLMKIIRDIRYAFRGLARRPGFTAAAMLSLGLGIGATSAIFTLVNAVFFQQIPVPKPDQVVVAYSVEQDVSFLGQASYPNYADARQQSAQTADLAAFQRLRLNWAHGDRPERVVGQIVTDNYFSALSVKSLLGRVLTPGDFAGGSAPATVISHRFWTSHLSSDPQVVGKTLMLNGHAFQVVGVTPAGFNGTSPFDGPDLWVPMSTYKQISPFGDFFDSREMGMFEMVARLRPGVSLDRATAAYRLIADRLRQQYPDANKNLGIGILPIAQASIEPQARSTYARAGTLLTTVVCILLLIACSNVASLLLARGLVRQREVAVRLSLGVQRKQLARQLLTESIVLSFLGGALGLIISYWTTSLLWRFRPPTIPDSAIDLSFNSRVLIFTFALSLLTGALFGLAPALQAFRTDLAAILKDLSSSMTRSNRLLSWRSLLVIGQVTLSLVALIGSGLFLRSLNNLQRTDPGFAADRLIHLSFDLASQGYDEPRGRDFYRRALERVQGLPGVRSAAVATNQLLKPGGWCVHVIPPNGDALAARSAPPICANTVSSDYFKTLEIRLLQGRNFNTDDRSGALPVIIVNQTMAKRFVPGGNPIGARLRTAGNPHLELEIVGVVADSKYQSMSEGPTASFYRSLEKSYQPALSLYVRTNGDPKHMLETVRREVQALDVGLPLANVSTASDLISASIWSARTAAALLSIFGLLALVLATTGLYGVVAYSVTQRYREIGIRMALGARRWEVTKMVLLEVGKIVCIGLVLGCIVAAAGSWLASGLLYSVKGADPVTYVSASLLLAIVALLASFLATRRGMRIDPVQALKG
jgi:macrolide transport system ATP-binding/permease protein